MDVAGTLENNEGLLIKYFNKCKTKIIAENTEIIVFAISSVFECIFLFKLWFDSGSKIGLNEK